MVDKLRQLYWSRPRLITKYECHVVQYSRRKLTYEGFILNAFMAIMEEHSQEAKTEFCFGIPLHHFSRALLWVKHNRPDVAGRPFRRRRPDDDSKVFPSWSWAGWTGGIHYHDFSLLESDTKQDVGRTSPMSGLNPRISLRLHNHLAMGRRVRPRAGIESLRDRCADYTRYTSHCHTGYRIFW